MDLDTMDEARAIIAAEEADPGEWEPPPDEAD